MTRGKGNKAGPWVRHSRDVDLTVVPAIIAQLRFCLTNTLLWQPYELSILESAMEMHCSMGRMEVQELAVEHADDTSQRSPLHPNQERKAVAGTSEEKPPKHQSRRPNLLLEIPSRPMEDSPPNYVRINMPPTPSPRSTKTKFPPMPSPTARMCLSPGPSSSRSKPSLRNLLPRVSFKLRSPTSDVEKATIVEGEASSGALREWPSIPRSFSLTKIFSPTVKRTSSLPVSPIAHLNLESVHGSSSVEQHTSPIKGATRQISRSLSVPVNNKTKTIKRMDSLGGVFRVVPSTPRNAEGSTGTPNATETADHENNDGGEDIPEEQAVCRICLIELSEGGDTLKMECSCKGELALAHQECSIKWFSIKGNKSCDVCKEEVRNLPVTLLRIQSVPTGNARTGNRSRSAESQYRVWQDVPVLVIVGMLAYFCFLEQLLVAELGSGAIAIALPFSCVLSLLASMTSSTMVKKRYVWIYASIQFALVVLFAHLFYSLFRVQAVLSVLLATFAGFGVAMCGNCIIIEFLRWRRRLQAWLESRRSRQENSLASQSSESARPSQMGQGPTENEEQRAENSSTSRVT
ncbi:hypothetical protein H6P81_011707 [Aristolochia fimbriata]|uniref:RING-CH-type domain-containing protein n=1 Tax=Aristolochia fimbriata TaxID=158543 RepID=A0AAV7EA56_ARIFI|nr:hypothetical protein H6P81_011707 [Aristolochia fimbriata]